MAIDRSGDLVPADDAGDAISGDPVDSAYITLLLDRLDARWSRATTTLTGTQTVVSFSEADVLLCNNASDLTIRSLTAPASPAKPGKRLVLMAIGAGNVFVNHQDTTGTTAADRIDTAVGVALGLVGGYGVLELVYNDSASRWRVVAHEQGGWLTYTPTWTGTGSNPSLGDGTLRGRYYRRGRQVEFEIHLIVGSTTTLGNGTYAFALPYAVNGDLVGVYPGLVLDSGTQYYMVAGIPASTTTINVAVHGSGTLVAHNAPMTWAVSDQLRLHGTLLEY